MLVAALNPCPCGFYGSQTHECRCTGAIISRYLGKISGPLLDRIDLHIEVPAVPYKELRAKDTGTSSEQCAQRVARARDGSTAARILQLRNSVASGAEASVRWTRRASVRSRWRCAEWVSARARMTGF